MWWVPYVMEEPEPGCSIKGYELGVETSWPLLKQGSKPTLAVYSPTAPAQGEQCQGGDDNGSHHRHTNSRQRQGEGSGSRSCWVIQPSQEKQGMRLGADLPTMWLRLWVGTLGWAAIVFLSHGPGSWLRLGRAIEACGCTQDPIPSTRNWHEAHSW